MLCMRRALLSLPTPSVFPPRLLAQEGARLQLQKGQINCGVELALLLVEAYRADGLPPSEEAVERLNLLLDAFPRQGRPAGADPPVGECSRVVAAAVKWLRRWAARACCSFWHGGCVRRPWQAVWMVKTDNA